MCEFRGPNCKGDTGPTKTYTCAYCCNEKKEVTCCVTCYREFYQKKSLICQKPSCVEHTDEILKKRAEAKQKENAESEAQKNRQAEDQLGAETVTVIGNLKRDFPNSRTAQEACPVAAAGQQDVKALLAAAKAAKWAAANIPGVKADQMFEIFYFAFSRGSTVVVGGSRVRTFYSNKVPYSPDEVPHSENSDLDVGYGSLNAGQVSACRMRASEVKPGLPIEDSLIIRGNTIGKKEIESPQEFFQRSGERSPMDEKRKTKGIERYYPSGSVTFSPDGDIAEQPPGK
jgi:hypothetical protein